MKYVETIVIISNGSEPEPEASSYDNTSTASTDNTFSYNYMGTPNLSSPNPGSPSWTITNGENYTVRMNASEGGTSSLFGVDWSKEGYYSTSAPLLTSDGKGYFIDKTFLLKTLDRMNPLNFVGGTPASNRSEAIAAVTEYLSQVPIMMVDESKRYPGSIVLKQYYLNGRATNWTGSRIR